VAPIDGAGAHCWISSLISGTKRSSGAVDPSIRQSTTAALTHLVESHQFAHGDHVLMISNGVGVSLAAAVVEITSLPAWATGHPEPFREKV
jgi:hypothetical protein